MALRWDLAKVQREIQDQEKQLKVITDDQGRLRLNLREMPTTAAAYKRYLEMFDQQETQIEASQAKVKELQGTEHTKKKAFDDFITAVDVEWPRAGIGPAPPFEARGRLPCSHLAAVAVTAAYSR